MNKNSSWLWPALNVAMYGAGRIAIKNPRVPVPIRTFPFLARKPFYDTALGKGLSRQSKAYALESFKAGFEGAKIKEIQTAGLSTVFPGASTITTIFHDVGQKARKVLPGIKTKDMTLAEVAERYQKGVGAAREKLIKATVGLKKARKIGFKKPVIIGAAGNVGVQEFLGDNNTMEDRLMSAAKGGAVGAGAVYAARAAASAAYKKLRPRLGQTILSLGAVKKELGHIARPAHIKTIQEGKVVMKGIKPPITARLSRFWFFKYPKKAVRNPLDMIIPSPPSSIGG